VITVALSGFVKGGISDFGLQKKNYKPINGSQGFILHSSPPPPPPPSPSLQEQEQKQKQIYKR
jgi:hypothetical protein